MGQKKYYKLLVIGDQNTGKTSIIHRYVHGVFRENYEVTIGAGINLKEIAWNDDCTLKLEFFDIGGECYGNLYLFNQAMNYNGSECNRGGKESVYDERFLPQSRRSFCRHRRDATQWLRVGKRLEKGS